MIKAICFDLDGVYFTSQSFQKFKKNLPKEINDENVVNRVLYKSEEMLNFKKGLITEEQFWDYATRELGIKTDFDGICELLRESYQINNDVKEYVEKVRKAGYKTCICTNNFVTRIREIDNEWGFLDLFDVKILSYEVGHMKPDIEIYKALVEKSGVLPEEIVYSDDSEDKLEGAKQLGINTFVYTTFEDFVKNLESLGVKV